MIFFDEHTKTFYLESKNVSYIFCVNECGFLNHLYYGKRISREDLSHTVYLVDRGHGSNIAGKWRDKSLNVYANECPAYGRSDYRESMLAFDFDGVRVGDFVYSGYTIYDKKPELKGLPSVRGNQTLEIILKDDLHGAKVSFTIPFSKICR